MKCLNAVILLWTCIIAFHASVTAFEIKGMDIRAFRVNTCRGLLKSINVFFVDVRNEKNQILFDIIYQTPNATVGPLRHITAFYDKSPCGEGMKEKFQEFK